MKGEREDEEVAEEGKGEASEWGDSEGPYREEEVGCGEGKGGGLFIQGEDEVRCERERERGRNGE